MKTKEFELKMQELKLQYTIKSNEINIKKDAVKNEKMQALIACDDLFHAKRRELFSRIEDLCTEIVAMDADDPKHDDWSNRIKIIQKEINLLLDENIANRNKISCKYAEKLRPLNEEHKQLVLWLDEEKIKVMREFIESEQEIPDYEKDNVQ